MLDPVYLHASSISDLVRLANFAKTAVPRQRPFENEAAYKYRLVNAILRGWKRSTPRAQRDGGSFVGSVRHANRLVSSMRRPRHLSATGT